MKNMKGKTREQLEERILQLEESRRYWMGRYQDMSKHAGEVSNALARAEQKLEKRR